MLSAKEKATEIVRTLRQHGYQAYLVGGCVRDLLLGREPADYDVATDATPDEVMHLFPRTWAVGAQFGVVLVPVDDDASKARAKSPPSAAMASTPMADIPTRSSTRATRRKTCSAATSPSTACCSIR